MATDLERLVVQMSADIKSYEREMQRAVGVTNRQARAIEARWRQANSNLDSIGAGMARGLIAPLTGIAAALSVREVAAYADAWTKAKNSLAVAGVVGTEQAAVLDRLYKSAIDNATPIGALSELFGKAAQASDNLGASNEELIQFTDGVAVALKVAGTGAGAASGALTQLGQLLGSARVQAEEFNSVNEAARPILIAVANGLDAAGGSVTKLKALVNEGEVSGREFFQAFLRGLPSISAMAANSTQTIEQGFTNVTTAFTKYIGQTDESLGASQRLVVGLNALADNFQETGDIVVQLASIIAGALVGRAIGGMLVQLGLATTAVTKFVAALRAATTLGALATAMTGISAAAGPIGLVVGGTAVAALTLFSSTAVRAAPGAKLYAEALKQVEDAGKGAAEGVNAATQSLTDQQFNRLAAGVKQGEAAITSAHDAAVALFSEIINNASRRIITEAQLDELKALRDDLGKSGDKADEVKQALYRLASSNPKFQLLADQLAPLLDSLQNAISATDTLKGKMASLAEATYPSMAEKTAYDKAVAAGEAFVSDAKRRAALTKDQLDLENQIAEVKKRAASAGVVLSDKQASDLAQTELAGAAARSAEGRRGGGPRSDSFERAVQGYRERADAMLVEAQAFGKGTYEMERARAAQDLLNAAKEKYKVISPEVQAQIDAEADAYGRAAEASEKAVRAQQDWNNLQQEFGDFAVDNIASIAAGYQSWNDVLKNGLGLLTQMALKAALLGQGPLAGLSGNAASGGGVGGLVGALFSGFKGFFKDGGRLGAGQWGIAGEDGPEIINGPAQITPASRMRAQGGRTLNANISISLAGANGDAAIAQAARQAAAAGAAMALRQVPGLSVQAVRNHQRRFA